MKRSDFWLCACGSRNKLKWTFCAKCGESATDAVPETAPEASEAPAPEVASVPWGAVVGWTAGFALCLLVYSAFKEPAKPLDPAGWTAPTLPPSLPPTVTVPNAVRLGGEDFDEGRRLLADGRARDAVTPLQRAVGADASNALYQATLGQALWRAGSKPEAIDHCRTAVLLEPDSTIYRLDLARALADSGKTSEALQEFDILLRGENPGPDVLQETARLYAAGDAFAKAAPLLKRAAEQAPQDLVLRQELAFALQKTGDKEGASALYSSLLQQEPGAVIARGLLAELLVGDGKIPEAIELLNQGIALNPAAPLLHRGLASVLERNGRIKDAALAYREYARLNPQAPDAKQLEERAAELEAKAAHAAS